VTPCYKRLSMPESAPLREDRIRSLAVRFKNNLLTTDDLARELTMLTRSERSALVEFLAALDKGPIKFKWSYFDHRN